MKRHGFNRVLPLLIAALTLLSLMPAACSEPELMPKPKPDKSSAAPGQETAAPTGPSFIGDRVAYTGEGEHVYLYDEGTEERMREENAVFLADRLLDDEEGHPKISHAACVIHEYNQSFTIPDQKGHTSIYMCDEELRSQFIERINGLILGIADMSADEFYCGLREAVAMLDDSMTYITLPAAGVFPLALMPIFDEEGGCGIYVRRAEKSCEAALGARLTAINGILTEDILERLRPLFPCGGYANDAAFVYSAVSPSDGSFSALLNCITLVHAGVIGAEDGSASFSFEGADGSAFELEIDVMERSDIAEAQLCDYAPDGGAAGWTAVCTRDRKITALMPSFDEADVSSNIWYGYDEASGVMYVRFNAFNLKAVDLKAKLGKLSEDIDGAEGVKKLVLDLRRCSAGSAGSAALNKELIWAFKRMNFDGSIYVLIDGSTCGCAVVYASLLRRFVDGTVLVGETAGTAPKNFSYDGGAGGRFYLDYVYLDCRMAGNTILDAWPDSERLEPDITVSITEEDFKNGVDSVLRAVNEAE